MAQMPDSFKPIDMPDSFQPISVESPQLQPSSTSGLLQGGILDPNVSLLDKAKNVLFGQKTDTAGHELQGPGMQEIPGVASVTDKLQHAIDPTESPFYTGLRPLAAGAVKLIGGTLASGFDPRTAGIKASDAVPPRELTRTSDVLVPKVTPEILQGDLPLQPEQPSINASLEPPKPVETNPAVAKLQQAVEDIKPLNKQQQDIYTLERSQRLAKMKGVSTPGEAGYQQQLGTLKGPMDKISFEPLKLDQSDVDSLFDVISSHPAGIGYNEIKAKTGLAKILSGQVPQKNEIDLLTDIFGEKVTTNLIQNMPAIDKAKGVVSELVNLPKSLMASFDMSAPFRQGLGLAHKKEFWTSFDDMARAFGSENAFNAIQDNIAKSPNFQLSQDAGLHLSNLTNMTNREEAFMSSWAERIPGVGRVVRASDRAYVGFLNKLRSDTFSRLVDDAENASKSLQLTAKDSTELAAAKLANPKTNAVLANEMANFVNTATGRGNLGALEPSAVTLNNMFFSPRLIASRVRMLNPQTYIQASPAVRKEYIKSLLAIASVGATVTGLGKAAGGTVEGPSSTKILGYDSGPITLPVTADADKVKFGDTRLDPFGGFQQYIVAASRLISGQQESSTTGKLYDLGEYGKDTRLSVAGRFTANKLAPVPKFAYDLLAATKKQPFDFSDESARLFIPMVIQDVIDLAATNPKLIPALGVASGLGMGVQTYPQPGITTQIGNLLQR